MLNIEYIRENIEKVKKNAQLKNRKVDIDLLLKTDEEYRAVLQEINHL
ncbi:MAG: serine--tRNA ligase, partial [Patescibacteria group bacterium]